MSDTSMGVWEPWQPREIIYDGVDSEIAGQHSNNYRFSTIMKAVKYCSPIKLTGLACVDFFEIELRIA